MVDCFSRFAWSKFYMKKTATNVVSFLESIFEKDRPKVLQTDNAQEFKSDIVAELCKKFNVKHVYSLPHNPTANAYIERFNQSIKLLISRHQTHHETKKYDLQGIVDIYNSSVHASTNKRPIELHYGNVSQEDKDAIVQKKEHKAAKMLQNLHPLEEGDIVRISLRSREDRSLIKSKFRKGYRRNWSEDTYTVTKKIQPRKNELEYYLLDEFGSSKFYRQDLLLVS